MLILAASRIDNPLFWALVVGWILTVVLHEFAHGLVAYIGGDYTIKERGGLTFNPIQYVDPLMSLILPAVFLLLGGIPLPGGATYIRKDLLKNRYWETAVAAAGPLMNFILFLILGAFLHPRVGWIDPRISPEQWTSAQKFVGGLAFLQLFSVFLNLVPVPPLDGFQMIAPFLPEEIERKATTPPLSSLLFFGYFMLLWSAPAFSEAIFRGVFSTSHALLGPTATVRMAYGFGSTIG